MVVFLDLDLFLGLVGRIFGSVLGRVFDQKGVFGISKAQGKRPRKSHKTIGGHWTKNWIYTKHFYILLVVFNYKEITF